LWMICCSTLKRMKASRVFIGRHAIEERIIANHTPHRLHGIVLGRWRCTVRRRPR
jgi:hypothetical protein